MLDALLRLIDRLVQLKSYRLKRLRSALSDVVEPCFSDLLLVHRDYVQMFLDADSQLESSAQSYETRLFEVADKLEKQRIEFEPVRVKLKALAEEMAGSRAPVELGNFVRVLAAYFSYFPEDTYFRLPWPETHASALVRIFRVLGNGLLAGDLPVRGEDVPLFARSYAHRALEGQQARWSEVCEAYVQAKHAAIKQGPSLWLGTRQYHIT